MRSTCFTLWWCWGHRLTLYPAYNPYRKQNSVSCKRDMERQLLPKGEGGTRMRGMKLRTVLSLSSWKMHHTSRYGAIFLPDTRRNDSLSWERQSEFCEGKVLLGAATLDTDQRSWWFQQSKASRDIPEYFRLNLLAAHVSDCFWLVSTDCFFLQYKRNLSSRRCLLVLYCIFHPSILHNNGARSKMAVYSVRRKFFQSLT